MIENLSSTERILRRIAKASAARPSVNAQGRQTSESRFTYDESGYLVSAERIEPDLPDAG